jgi:hypothetical protein
MTPIQGTFNKETPHTTHMEGPLKEHYLGYSLLPLGRGGYGIPVFTGDLDLLGFIGIYWVLTGIYWVLTGINWDVLGFTGDFWGFTGYLKSQSKYH